MKFTKMQGCGNDYVYVNGFTEKLSPQEKPEIVRKLSDRHFGIGGDGVIFINPAEEADFEMEMYNADGSRSEMCGNGIRCVAKYVYDKGLTDREDITIVSAGKIKYLKLTVEGRTATDRGCVTMVQVNMGQPVLAPMEVPVIAEATRETPVGPAVVDASITVDGEEYRMTCVSMGNPHAVVFMDGVDDLKIEEIGPKFEQHERFPDRVNTEFVERMDRKNLKMRVWERGSGETMACGTGACATAVAAILNGCAEREVTVHLLGGDLEIQWDETDNCVYMTGAAATAFTGEFDPEELRSSVEDR